MNTMNLLPLDVYNSPWLRFYKKLSKKSIKICGKWALYFNDKSLMNEVWKVAIKSLIEDKLYGVQSLECSTNYVGQSGGLCSIGMLIFVLFSHDLAVVIFLLLAVVVLLFCVRRLVNDAIIT